MSEQDTTKEALNTNGNNKGAKLVIALMIAGLLLRIWLGWVFVESGWAKTQNLAAFYNAAHAYKLLPPMLTQLYASMLPWVELLAGGLLLLGFLTRWMSGTISLMLLSFIIAIGWALYLGDEIDCGCFVGGVVEPVTWGLMIRDVIMLVASVYLILRPSTFLSLDGWLNDGSSDNVETD